MAVTSPSHTYTYDVFLNFRGPDTRHGFTGHLHKALNDSGFHAFIDDEDLQSGGEITPKLKEAIEKSRIAITVLSENYASSSHCLTELDYILKCFHGMEDRLLLPVFYKVDPADVRHQKGSCGEAMARLHITYQPNMKIWKTALHQVAKLSGFHFQHGHEYEHEFIRTIVDRVSRKLRDLAAMHVADYKVGLESRELEIKKLLSVGCDDVIHIIGMYGMGGVGKSTLARAVYNLITDQFRDSCFLQNVRQESNKHGLKHLQSILLSKILGEKKIKLASEHEGISLIQRRLKGKKVLLILDDVDNIDQLKALVGSSDWFGPGSRIIITTRDQHLLKSHEVERRYEVKKLNDSDARQLLTWNAFKTKEQDVDPSYKEVLDGVLEYASGLPLALEVIGSNLFDKSTEEWESAIKRYKRIPINRIQEILKVSFDALEEEEQSVFLDIACCLKGSKQKEVEYTLRALYGHCMKYHIGVLVGKSLIKISDGRVELHDLIEDMGKEIDQKKSPKEPGMRRRLWAPKDIIQVLKDNTGTSEIEIICWNFSIPDEEEWNENAFMEMKNLKILIITSGNFSKLPNLPEGVKKIKWKARRS